MILESNLTDLMFLGEVFFFFYQSCTLCEKLFALHCSVLFELSDKFLFGEKSFDALNDLPDISDFIFDGLDVVDHIGSEELIDLKLFVYELLELFRVSQLVNYLSVLDYLFLKPFNKLRKNLHAVLLRLYI